MTMDGIQYMCQSSGLERLACRTPWHLLGYVYDSRRRRRRTANRPFEGQIQHARWLKYGSVWAISLCGKNGSLMRSVLGNSEDDCAGVVEVEQAGGLAVAATATEVKVDKVPISELLAHTHGRTAPQLRQTAVHPEGGQ